MEIRKGNKAIRVIGSMVFYGQYYKEDFQVLDSNDNTPRKVNNMKKKYNF